MISGDAEEGGPALDGSAVNTCQAPEPITLLLAPNPS